MEDQDNETIIAADTISLLESRLRRLELLISGSTSSADEPTPSPPTSPQDTITSRLNALEKEFKSLTSKSPVVQQLLNLYTSHTQLFDAPTSVPPPPNTTLTPLILSHSSAYPTTSSRLTSLNDHPIPPPSHSVNLISLQPRLDRAKKVQMELEDEVAVLRERSVNVVERWVEVGVLGSGEVWGEWEGSLQKIEREIRRAEAVEEREKEEV